MRPTIAILTDFGTRDPSVAVMKGVMRGICPPAEFIDVSHEIQAQDLQQTAFTLLTAWRWFPSGTIFLIVVDPGVGSDRRPVVVTAGGCHFVAPDNGLLSWLLAEAPPELVVAAADPAWHLAEASHTFHGRDVFAPLAAHLAGGRSPLELGSRITDLRRLPVPLLVVEDGAIRAEVLHLDHFGNLVTSLGACRWRNDDELLLQPRFGNSSAGTLPARHLEIAAGPFTLTGVRKTFSAVAVGETLAYVGSSGFLELAVNQGNAAQRYGLQVGDRVRVSWSCSNS